MTKLADGVVISSHAKISKNQMIAEAKSLNKAFGPRFKTASQINKIRGHLKEFWRKKLFCPESVTKLCDLTVIEIFRKKV